MALIQARCTNYVNKTTPAGATSAIEITGVITDDVYGDKEVTYVIQGEDLASLPASNPATDGTPSDARFQAIMALAAKAAKYHHLLWMSTKKFEPVAVPLPSDKVAAIPVLDAATIQVLAPDA